MKNNTSNEVRVPDSFIRHFPRPFKVRQDNALTLSDDVMSMLEWSAGDPCWYTVDIKNRKLIVSPTDPNSGVT